MDKSHLADDYEVLRTQVIRRLSAQVGLLRDGLHALRNGRTGVAEEFLDRSLTAIEGEVTRLKDLDGGRTMIVGFDFGTTNSLLSVVVGDRVIHVLDEDGRPHPSVVRYEGEAVVVGREARQALEEVGIGVYGNTVRSPKFFLGQEVVSVGGVDRSPIDIVADVIRHVRTEFAAKPPAPGSRRS